jgi:6-phosphogluconolactonase (cycloisomerase 2 family)
MRYKSVSWSFLLLSIVAISLLIACGTTDTGTSSQTVAPEHLYWANPNSGNISVYTIDPVTGALTAGSTVQTNFNPLFVISSDPQGRFLYASGVMSNSTSVSTIAYTVDSTTGKLAQISGSPFSFGVFIVNQVNTATFLYAADNITNQIHTISIDPATGALTRLVASTTSGGSDPFSPRLNKDNTLLGIANQSSNTISLFKLDPSTGGPTPTPGSPHPASSVTGVSCPPKGGCGSDLAFVNNFLYYGNAALAATTQTGNVIFGFAVSSTGVLTPLPASPFADPSFAPQSLAASNDGRFLYVAHAGGGVVGYTVAGDGTLTLIPGAVVNGSGVLAVEPKTKFLYVSDTASTNGILGYRIDATSGALTPIAGTPVGAGTQGGQIVIR